MNSQGRSRRGGTVERGRGKGGSREASSQMIYRRCGVSGHFERGCAMPAFSHSIIFHKFSTPGHIARDCPDTGSAFICCKFHKPGHYARDCKAADVVETGGKFCKYCKSTNHIIDDCVKLAKKVADKKRKQKDSLNES